MERTTINISCGSTSASICIESEHVITREMEESFVKDITNDFFDNAHPILQNNFPKLTPARVSIKFITPNTDLERSIEVERE